MVVSLNRFFDYNTLLALRDFRSYLGVILIMTLDMLPNFLLTIYNFVLSDEEISAEHGYVYMSYSNKTSSLWARVSDVIRLQGLVILTNIYLWRHLHEGQTMTAENLDSKIVQAKHTMDRRSELCDYQIDRINREAISIRKSHPPGEIFL